MRLHQVRPSQASIDDISYLVLEAYLPSDLVSLEQTVRRDVEDVNDIKVL